MFSVFFKPGYYLVKYYILQFSFFMIPSIARCAGEDIKGVTVNDLDSQIKTLSAELNHHIANNFVTLSEISTQYKTLLQRISASSTPNLDTDKLTTKLLEEIFPQARDTLTNLNTSAMVLLRDSSNQQNSAYRILSDCNTKIGQIETTADQFLTELIRLKADCEILVGVSRDVRVQHFDMSKNLDELRWSVRQLNKLISDFKVDFGLQKMVLQQWSSDLQLTTGKFDKLSTEFFTTVEKQLAVFSNTFPEKISTNVKQSMQLTAKFQDLKVNLTDAINQATFPKEFKFHTETVVDYVTKCNNEFKTEWNSVSDYCVLKPYLKQGFSEMARQGKSLNDIEGLADLSVQILSNFEFPN